MLTIRRTLTAAAVVAFSFAFSSCTKDNGETDNNANLTLNISGLEDLGNNARYEGWIIVNGNPVSTGVFSVNASGQPSQTRFAVNQQQLHNATAFVLTIEPYPDPSPAPSGVSILAGNFSNGNASLTINHERALHTDFASATGKYILATPTTATMDDERSGLWFIDMTSGTPAAGLNLPTLPSGWQYEGWAVINGKPVTTGKFSMPTGADAAAPFSGPLQGPPFPGEDFIQNAPTGLTFPTNLAGGMSVITVEPMPDNSPEPFMLRPLSGNIPTDATDHQTYTMNRGTSYPTGTVSRN